MLEKAKKSIVQQIVIDNNTFKGSCIIFEDIAQARYIMRYRFILNGKEYLGEGTPKGFCPTKEEIVLELFRIVSDEISKSLVVNFLQEDPYFFRG